MGAPGHSGRVRALSLVGDAIVSDGGGNSTQRAPGPFTCSRIQGCQREGQGLRTLQPWGRQIPGGHLTHVQALLGEAQAQGWRVRASPQPLRMPLPRRRPKGQDPRAGWGPQRDDAALLSSGSPQQQRPWPGEAGLPGKWPGNRGPEGRPELQEDQGRASATHKAGPAL